MMFVLHKSKQNTNTAHLGLIGGPFLKLFTHLSVHEVTAATERKIKPQRQALMAAALSIMASPA